MLIRISDIVEYAARATRISAADIKSKCRLRNISTVRFAVYFMAREQGYTFPHIGRVIGNRDHSTVIHGCREAEYKIARDANFAALVNTLRQAIANHKPSIPVAWLPPQPEPEELPADHGDEINPSPQFKRDGLDSDAMLRSIGSKRLAEALLGAMAA